MLLLMMLPPMPQQPLRLRQLLPPLQLSLPELAPIPHLPHPPLLLSAPSASSCSTTPPPPWMPWSATWSRTTYPWACSATPWATRDEQRRSPPSPLGGAACFSARRWRPGGWTFPLWTA